jgi:membrane protein DedA with SNARE-associated domain
MDNESAKPEARVSLREFVVAGLFTFWSWMLLLFLLGALAGALSPVVSAGGRILAAIFALVIGAVWLERTLDIVDFRRRYPRTGYFEGWRRNEEPKKPDTD